MGVQQKQSSEQASASRISKQESSDTNGQPSLTVEDGVVCNGIIPPELGTKGVIKMVDNIKDI